jgi:hypothetical protein
MADELRFLGYPDTRATFQEQYRDFLKNCDPFVTVAARLVTHKSKTQHQDAVLDQCILAWDMFAALTMLVATGFPIPAVGLARNLMEVVMGALLLTDHPEFLNDFSNEAEYVILKIMHLNHASEMDQAQEERYSRFKEYFGNRGWYRTSVGDLADRVGFGIAYDTFYREACTITHGGALPLLTPRYGVGCRDIEPTPETEGGRDYGRMALQYATHMIFTLLEKANLVFKLGFDEQVAEFWTNFESRGWFRNTPLA